MSHKRNKRSSAAKSAAAAIAVVVAAASFGPALSSSAAGSSVVVSSQVALQAADGEFSGSLAVDTTKPDPAKVKFTKEQAEAKLKKLFPALEQARVTVAELGDSHTYPLSNNQMVWSFQWSYTTGNSSSGFSSTVDAITGDLINVYLPSSIMQSSTYYPPKLSKEQALDVAKAFISQAVSSLDAGDLIVKEGGLNTVGQPLFGPVTYSFSFAVKKKGVPDPTNQLGVTVSGDGNVLSFSKPDYSSEYPSSTPAVSQEKAEQQFADDFNVELSYVPIHKHGTLTGYFLGWVPSGDALSVIDAQSGVHIDSYGKEVKKEQVVYTDIPESSKAIKLRDGKDTMTADQAADIMKQFGEIPEGRSLQSTFLSKGLDEDESVWSLSWENTSANLANQTFARVNAVTGEIEQFNLEEYASEGQQVKLLDPGTAKLTNSELNKKALELVAEMSPNASRDLKLQTDTSKNDLQTAGQHRFYFADCYKGIPVQGEGVTMVLDDYGRLLEYNSYRRAEPDNLKGIASSPAISKEKALELYRSSYDLQLSYYRAGGYYENGKYVGLSKRLVYAPTNKVTSNWLFLDETTKLLDAATGKWIAPYDSLTSETAGNGKPVDITGHWAEKDLTVLAEYGVLKPDENGKINPDQTVTVRQWLEMVCRAVQPAYQGYTFGSGSDTPIAGVKPGSDDYQLVQFALNYDWIDGKQPLELDATLTRDELAERLSYLVKYAKLSDLLDQDKGISKFSDASSIKHKGAVLLAVKLGLLDGQAGKFNPARPVTRAEVATVLMRLVKLQGRTDQAITKQYY